MIALATPWIFGAAIAAAAITTALHLLSVRRPPALLLPTMRFLPDRAVRAVSRTTKPSDLGLLMLRVAALLLAGLALAGVRWQPKANQRGRVVIVDRGQSVGDVDGWRRAVATEMGDHDRALATSSTVEATRVILVDSVATLLTPAATTALHVDTLSIVHARASLAGAMLLAFRAAAELGRDVARLDSVELVLVSPVARESVDEAMKALRVQWPGRIRVVSIPGMTDSGHVAVRVDVLGSVGDDPVGEAITRISRTTRIWGGRGGEARISANGGGSREGTALRGADSEGSGLRVVRVTRDARVPVPVASTDASGSASMSPDVLVEWPASGAPTGWKHVTPDTIGGIVTHGQALVAPFIRSSRAPDPLPIGAQAIAWWSDGEVAAVETATGRSCRRSVAVQVASAGDALLGEGARPLLSALVAPCGGDRDPVVQTASWRDQLAGTGALASAEAMRASGLTHSAIAPWLLAAALLLFAAEWWWRERVT